MSKAEVYTCTCTYDTMQYDTIEAQAAKQGERVIKFKAEDLESWLLTQRPFRLKGRVDSKAVQFILLLSAHLIIGFPHLLICLSNSLLIFGYLQYKIICLSDYLSPASIVVSCGRLH